MDRNQLANTHVKLLALDLLSLSPSPRDPTSFTSKGISLSRAEILGVVTYRELKPDKFLKFTIDDGTGLVVCLLWLNHLSSPYFSRRFQNPSDVQLLADVARHFASEVNIGVLARVRGRITGYRGSVQVTVSDVCIERNDPNVEVLHWLECVKLTRSLARSLATTRFVEIRPRR